MENQSNDEQVVNDEIWSEDRLFDNSGRDVPDEEQAKKVVEEPPKKHDKAPVRAEEEPSESEEEPSESDDETDAPAEEIIFQRIMDYKAYRRGMTLNRVLITLACAAALAMLGYVSIFLSVVGVVTALIIGAISILVSQGNEQTYNIYNTRVVIKRRGDDKRKSVPLENIISVKYKSAFYEKRRCIGTVTISAKKVSGGVKKYKLKHIFDAKPIVEFFNQILSGRNDDNGGQGRK